MSVRNGTATPGLAASAVEELRERHFTVTGSGNAASRDHTTTVVSYGPGEREHAATLARLFPGAAVEAADGPGLTVTLGADYRPDAGGAGNGGGGTGASGKTPGETGRSAADDPCADLSYG